MRVEWTVRTVRALVEDGILERPMDGNHGELHPKSSDFTASGIPFIMASDLAGGRLDTENCSFIPETLARSLRKGFARPGDVLLSHKATMGRTALVGSLDVPFLMLTPQVTYYRVRDRNALEPRYLKVYFDSQEFQNLLERWGNKGSTRAYLGISAQLDLPILIPPIHIQGAIAHILGAFADKIELNRRMNETLEAMARALFKSWFVDFDPVRAKAEGRAPSGMDAETAKLFPSELEESELGLVPKGWQVAQLGDVLELKRGYDLPAAQRLPGRVPIVSSSGTSGVHNEARVCGPGIATGRYGTIGQVFYIRADFWPLNTTLYVRDFKGSDTMYVYHLLSLLNFNKFSDKAAVPGVNRNHLHQERVVAAPRELQRRFANITGPWLDLAARNESQRVQLTEIRNALLPKLLSGEISVAEIESPAEIAT